MNRFCNPPPHTGAGFIAPRIAGWMRMAGARRADPQSRVC